MAYGVATMPYSIVAKDMPWDFRVMDKSSLEEDSFLSHQMYMWFPKKDFNYHLNN